MSVLNMNEYNNRLSNYNDCERIYYNNSNNYENHSNYYDVRYNNTRPDNHVSGSISHTKRRVVVKESRLAFDKKLAFVIGILITIILVSIFSIKTFAYTNNNNTGIKKYHSIVIYCGDSVASIAEATLKDSSYNSLMDYENEILHINNIEADTTLIPGNYIVIPYYD